VLPAEGVLDALVVVAEREEGIEGSAVAVGRIRIARAVVVLRSQPDLGLAQGRPGEGIAAGHRVAVGAEVVAGEVAELVSELSGVVEARAARGAEHLAGDADARRHLLDVSERAA